MWWALSWWLGMVVCGAAAAEPSKLSPAGGGTSSAEPGRAEGGGRGERAPWSGSLVEIELINKHFYLLRNRSPYLLRVVADRREEALPLPPGASLAYERRRVRRGQGFHLSYRASDAAIRVEELLTRLREVRERAEAADYLSDRCLDALDLAVEHGDRWDVAAVGVCASFFGAEAGGLRREIAELREQILETRLVAEASRTKKGPYAENFVPGRIDERVRSGREVLPYVWVELGITAGETPLSEDWGRQGSLSTHGELSMVASPEWRWGHSNTFSRLRATVGMENVSGGLRHDQVYEVGEPWLVGGEAGTAAPLAGNTFVGLNILQRYAGLDLHTRLGSPVSLDLGGGLLLSRSARIGFNRNEPPWFEDPALSLAEEAGADAYRAAFAGGPASRWYGEVGLGLTPMGFERRGGRPDRGLPSFAFGLEYRVFPLAVEPVEDMPLRRAGEAEPLPGVELLRHAVQLDLGVYF